MKVLIADDSQIIRKSLKRVLLSLNDSLQIREAKDIKETLESIQEFNPGLIILDIRIPDGNWIDALKIIKKMKPTQKVMMFTNYTNSLYQQKCKASGADYFFDKSDDFENIYFSVKELNL